MPLLEIRNSEFHIPSKKEGEKKQSENMQDKNTMTNGVVITVYIESLKTRSNKQSENPMKKTKPHPRFNLLQATGTQGYDRRAQLLAYSRELRNGGSEKVQIPSNQSLPRNRSKKHLWLAQPVRLCSPSSRCIHERVEPKESKERKQYKKRSGSGNTCFTFLRKVKSMLKKLSCKEIKW